LVSIGAPRRSNPSVTMSRIRRASPSRSASLRLAAGAALLLAGFAGHAGAQETGALRGSLSSAAPPPVPDPLKPPAPAEPLFPVEPPSLAEQGPIRQPDAAAAAPQRQAEDIDDELAGAPDEADARPDRRANRQVVPDNPAADPENDPEANGQPGSDSRTKKKAAAAEAPLTTSTVRLKSIDAADLERNTAARAESERARAIEAIGRTPEQNPFGPPGLRVGAFLLRPALDQGIEWTSNATNTAGGGSDFVSESTLRLDAASDWARHSASFSGYGTYRTSVTGTGYSEFRGAGNAAATIELGSRFTLNPAIGYELAPEDASSPVAIAGAVDRPLRQTLSGSLGLEKTLGRLQFAATGSARRNTYGNATLSDGSVLSQADRNQTLYSMALRGGYEISPALTPFIEAEFGRRIYDDAVDSSGYSRSAGRYGARGGLSLDFGEKLNGEISAGWLSEKPDDQRLAAVSGFAADANVEWSPVRGTIVSLTGSTEVEGSTTPSESGSILYSSALGVSRELRANLTGTATLGADWRRYAGGDRDFTWSAETSLTWWLNRYAGLKARARHEETSSTLPGRTSQQTSVYLGLTLRR
jgi:hypothetical protein